MVGIPGSTIPNNTYGWGRIDALAAWQRLHPSIAVQKTFTPGILAPGQTLTYTLTITPEHFITNTTGVVLTDTLPAGTSLVSATQPYILQGDALRWDFPSLAPGETRSVELAVQAPLTATYSITNSRYAVFSAEAPANAGLPVVTPVHTLLLTKPPPAHSGSPWRPAHLHADSSRTCSHSAPSTMSS